jgi:hypothetical protein
MKDSGLVLRGIAGHTEVIHFDGFVGYGENCLKDGFMARRGLVSVQVGLAG